MSIIDKLKLMFIERKVNQMLKDYASKIAGYRTHAVQVVAIVVGLAAFIWGPIDVGAIHLPKIEFKDLLEILQVGGGLSFLRLALNTKQVEGAKNETPK